MVNLKMTATLSHICPPGRPGKHFNSPSKNHASEDRNPIAHAEQFE